MVGAKDRFADLRASLAPCHDEYAVAFIQQSALYVRLPCPSVPTSY
jgi:hypothetical protein